MAGFDPVGSAPVASLAGGITGTIISPAPGYLYLDSTGSGGTGGGAIISGTAPLQVYAVSRESLQSETASLRAYSVAREVLMSLGTSSGIVRASVSIIW